MPHKRSSSNLVARFDDLQPFQSRQEIEEYLSHERIECLLCSRRFTMLAQHLIQKHGISSESYKEKLGLPLSKGIPGTRLRQIMKNNAISRRNVDRLKHGGNFGKRRSHRSSLYWRTVTNFDYVIERSTKVRKEKCRNELINVLKYCSSGMLMKTVAKLSGVRYSALTYGLRQNRDIRAAFMELTR